ncbi:MAG: hypothetical protein A2660_01170 [Candidatus Doudnabacteria bacterium RIFCSPHIGHO2_01_FULL_45_18]|uniref:Uncharacterized protein n=1 Tax=Candidatus Doudnabacteria bacterium RIFCSPHIGHO2_01_FULL_45_18 TaxID=1817823 RepID=A0A1F5NRK1_9BACT|nr:MAG: hypothetical protein A2660_01170 [Candidatus Doudnabacteria bacterium RIFCSPHIGHO2_01_FULL_45_18]
MRLVAENHPEGTKPTIERCCTGGWFKVHYTHKGRRMAGLRFRTFEAGTRELCRLNAEGKIMGDLIPLLTELRKISGGSLPWWQQKPLLFDATGRRPAQV